MVLCGGGKQEVGKLVRIVGQIIEFVFAIAPDTIQLL
jgi:hypothetical protein